MNPILTIKGAAHNTTSLNARQVIVGAAIRLARLGRLRLPFTSIPLYRRSASSPTTIVPIKCRNGVLMPVSLSKPD
jgi:hypothetical protein